MEEYRIDGGVILGLYLKLKVENHPRETLIFKCLVLKHQNLLCCIGTLSRHGTFGVILKRLDFLFYV